MSKNKKFCFHVVALSIAVVLLLNFIGFKLGTPIAQAVTADAEEESINDLLDGAQVVSNDDGYTLQAEGYLNMCEDLENDIEEGEYYIELNAVYSISDNSMCVEITLTTPSGEIIEQSGYTVVLDREAYYRYCAMEEAEKDDIQAKAMQGNDDSSMEKSIYEEQGGIEVDELAKILDIAIIVISLVVTVVSIAVVTWQAYQMSSGLVRNILSKVAMKALRNFINSNTLKSLIGGSILALLSSGLDIICTLFDTSLGKLIALLIDKVDGNENGRCFA